jgi:hypothetical protein
MAPDGEGFKLPPHQRVPLPTDLASLAAVVEMMRAQVPLIEVPNGLMPAEPYKHGWNVLPAPVWEYVHKHYSHFGCYENSVNWRSQFYLVDLPDGLPGWISEDTRLTDPDGRLTIRQPTLDWRVVNALLEGNPLPADVTLAQDQIANFNLLIASLVQSLITGVDLRTQLLALLDLLTKAPFSLEIHRDGLFEPGFRLKLLHRPPLGYILVHWDKRDDDLLPFRPFLGSGDTASIEAILHGPHGEMVPVVLRQWQGVMFPPAVHEVEVTLSESIVTIRFRPAALSNGAPDLKANIWRVRLGALTNEGGTLGPATVLLSVLRHEAFQPEATDSGWQCFDWNLENESPSIAQRARQACTKHGQQALATSVWFEDVVGHVRIADCTRFIAEG